MNIIQLHERVRFWVDVVASPRYESQDIDNALNVCIDNKVRESYDKNLPMNRSDSFQRVQRIRDELGPLVKKLISGSGLTISKDGTQNKLSLQNNVEDYGWLLSMRIQDSDLSKGWHPVYPLTFNRKNILSRNPFRRVRVTPQSKCYYYENEGAWLIEDSLGNLDNAEIWYLATPAIVNYGVEYTSSHSFSDGDVIIAIEETVYIGVTYKIGDKITILNPNLQITSGTVVFDYVECNIRSTTHEEISRRASVNLLLTAKEFDKATRLREEILAS